MSSSSREGSGSASPNTECTPLFGPFGGARKSASQPDNGSLSDIDRTEMDSIISRIVDPLGLGLDTGLQQRLDLESTSYGSAHASSGPDQDHIDDLSLPQGRVHGGDSPEVH